MKFLLKLIILISVIQQIKPEYLLFDYHQRKKLTVRSNSSKSFLVKNMMGCFGKCEENIDWCQAGNFNNTQDSKTNVCELFPSDRFTKTNNFTMDDSYHYFNVKTKCHIEGKPCQNEGRCIEGKCQCKEPYRGEQCEIGPPKSCKTLLNLNSSLPTGVYTINPTGTQALKVYCDMETSGGGWTLVYSYTFTDYDNFNLLASAIVPFPSWPTSKSQPPSVRISTTPPLSETDYNAVDFKLWKLIAGDEFMTKSNILHWINCKETGGSLINFRSGPVACSVIKNVGTVCPNSAPDAFWASFTCPSLGKGNQIYLAYDGRSQFDYPVHDPCGTTLTNHVKGQHNPHGNIYIR